MRVNVNGKWMDTSCRWLSELLTQLEVDGSAVATAVRGNFVSREDRHTTEITDGCHVEIVTPMQGG